MVLLFQRIISVKVLMRNSSVIRQKGESQNRSNKETKHVIFSGKTNISYPLIPTRACVYQGVRNFRFTVNLACLFLLPTF